MSLWDAIIPAVADIGGALLGTFANSSATSTSNKALKEANRLRQQAIDQATAIYGDLKTQSAPAVRYLQDVISNPVGGLYPDQIAAQQEERRQALNDISRTGLRGSGRAVTSSLKRVDSDFVNQALAQNRGNRQNAAGALTGQYFTAGDNTANALISGGNAAASTTEQAGNNTANLGTTNASLIGNTIGDIGSLIAQEAKGRDSRYATTNIPLRDLGSDAANAIHGGATQYSRGGVVTKRSRLHEISRAA